MSFTSYASLFLPAAHGRGMVVEAGPTWALDPAAFPQDADVVVWGRGPAPSGTPRATVLRSAAARERALRSLRRAPPEGFMLDGLRRIPPPDPAGGSTRRAARDALLGGALVVLTRGEPRPSILDAVASEAGALIEPASIRASSGGGAIATVRLSGGTDAILRAAPAGSPGDPTRAADALEVLSHKAIPSLLGRGRTAGASWSLETVLRGRRPAVVSDLIALQVAELCARLPRRGGPPSAPADDVGSLAALLPERSVALGRVAASIASVVALMPGVVRHGDIWAGNLLSWNDGLTGLIDWDGWHPGGVPGTDLIHLLATQQRLASRGSLASAWRSAPWRTDAFTTLTAEYWPSIGVHPGSYVLDGAGAAWWAGAAATTLARLPHRSTDERWLGLNVDPVLEAFDR